MNDVVVTSAKTKKTKGGKKGSKDRVAQLEAELSKANKMIARFARGNARLARGKARLARGKARLARGKAVSDAKGNLKDLMEERVPTSKLQTFRIRLPAEITIDPQTVTGTTEIIREFNSFESTIEKSASIKRRNSVHRLWADIIKLIRSDEVHSNRRSGPKRMVVYEWGIPHPTMKTSTQRIDFTVVPARAGFLSWLCSPVDLS
jgi:hypothetical protein